MCVLFLPLAQEISESAIFRPVSTTQCVQGTVGNSSLLIRAFNEYKMPGMLDVECLGGGLYVANASFKYPTCPTCPVCPARGLQSFAESGLAEAANHGAHHRDALPGEGRDLGGVPRR